MPLILNDADIEYLETAVRELVVASECRRLAMEEGNQDVARYYHLLMEKYVERMKDLGVDVETLLL